MESTNCNICYVKWKTDISSIKIALIPTNSRPLLQPKFWHVKNRPMIAALTSNNNKTLEEIEDKYSLIKSTNVNNEDYLEYNNPDVKLNSDGKIVCDNEAGVFHNNMYSGPGWKKSRTHPNTRTALSRPIKHWRKQLFPRQFNINNEADDSFYDITNSINSMSRGRRNNGGLFDKPNGYFITTKKVNKEISCLPIYINTTKDSLNSCVKLDIINYGKIINCSIKTALFKSRPGSYTSNSIYQFNSNKSYLQARSKLYEQLATVNNSTTQNSSFYLNYNLTKCRTAPSIVVNNNHFPISSKTNTRQKSKNAIRQNQYNITNKYGITSSVNYLVGSTITIATPLPTAMIESDILNNSTISLTESFILRPVFNYGTATINNQSTIGLEPIISGSNYTISPPVGQTVYTLRVTNSANYSVSYSFIVTFVRSAMIESNILNNSTITLTQSFILRPVFNYGTATIDNQSTINAQPIISNNNYTITPPLGQTVYTLRVTNSENYTISSTFTIKVVPLPTASLTVVPTASPTSSPYENNQLLTFNQREITLRPVFNFGTPTGIATINNLQELNGIQIISGGLYPVIPQAGKTSYTLSVANNVNYVVNFTFSIRILNSNSVLPPES